MHALFTCVCVCEQYVNPAYERLFGYSSEELLGKDTRELGKSENNKPDLHDCMNAQLRKGKVSDHFLSVPTLASISVAHARVSVSDLETAVGGGY